MGSGSDFYWIGFRCGNTFAPVHLGHKKDLGSRAPGPLFLQPLHTPFSWKNDPTREQIGRFHREQRKERYPYRSFRN